MNANGHVDATNPSGIVWSVDPVTTTSSRNKRPKERKEAEHNSLRHFSLKVCEKVEQMQVTTYQRVADELVKELCGGIAEPGGETMDERNIRRREYDALCSLSCVRN